MDSSQKDLKVYSLEEVKNESLPKGTSERELYDFKIEIIEKLHKILKGHKFVHTDSGKITYFTHNIKKLIDQI